MSFPTPLVPLGQNCQVSTSVYLTYSDHVLDQETPSPRSSISMHPHKYTQMTETGPCTLLTCSNLKAGEQPVYICFKNFV